jgi:serine/threonine protein kinase
MAETQVNKIGKYEIVKKLGDGATSTVFLARDAFNSREVAIKLVSQGALKDETRGCITCSSPRPRWPAN